jgi:Protein of unknown function (DUF1759)
MGAILANVFGDHQFRQRFVANREVSVPKECTQKKAEEIIKEVSFTNDGYDIAKKILIEEYNRPEVIALNRIQTFLKGNNQIGSASEAKRSARNMFQNTVWAVEKQKEQLFSYESWIVMYTVNRFTPELKAKGRVYLRKEKIESWKECLISFMKERECDSHNSEPQNSQSETKVNMANMTAKIMRPCDYCKGAHWIRTCQKFIDEDVNKRNKIVVGAGLGINCFGRSHTVETCRSDIAVVVVTEDIRLCCAKAKAR